MSPGPALKVRDSNLIFQSSFISRKSALSEVSLIQPYPPDYPSPKNSPCSPGRSSAKKISSSSKEKEFRSAWLSSSPINESSLRTGTRGTPSYTRISFSMRVTMTGTASSCMIIS